MQNSQPAGIGRLVRLGNRCAWNNLGRNVVFADASLRPVAIFGGTMFPDDDEASQFDLDIHAIVELTGTGQVAVLNHLGALRIFEPSWSGAPARAVGPDLNEVRQLEFVDDIERVVGLGDRLVTSRPRGQRLDGVMVSEPIGAARQRLGWSTAQEPLGFVTALAARSTPDGTGWVALGGEGWARLVEARHGRLGTTRWQTAVDFCCAVLVACGPPSGRRAAPSVAPASTTTTGGNWVEGGWPSSTYPLGLRWRPLALATTWRGGVGARRWSSPMACPTAWAVPGSCTRWRPVRA